MYRRQRICRRGELISLEVSPDGISDLAGKYADDGDGWNDLVLICRGTHVKTIVNGVVNASDPKSAYEAKIDALIAVLGEETAIAKPADPAKTYEVAVQSSNATSISWTVAPTSGSTPNWVSFTPTTGKSGTTLKITITPPSSTGKYQTTLAVTTADKVDTQTVTVTLVTVNNPSCTILSNRRRRDRRRRVGRLRLLVGRRGGGSPVFGRSGDAGFLLGYRWRARRGAGRRHSAGHHDAIRRVFRRRLLDRRVAQARGHAVARAGAKLLRQAVVEGRLHVEAVVRRERDAARTGLAARGGAAAGHDGHGAVHHRRYG